MTYKVGKCLLSDLLLENSMSQQDLAHKLNVTRQQINKYTTNKRVMSLEVAKNISNILKCSVEALYAWEKKQ